MTSIIVPLGFGVILPVAIVLITSLARINADNKRTKIIIKAIEANKDIDTDRLIESFKKPVKTDRQILSARLLRGCIYSLIGIALAIVGLTGYLCGADFQADQVSIPLIAGGICFAIGISYLIVYFVTRNQVNDSSENTENQ